MIKHSYLIPLALALSTATAMADDFAAIEQSQPFIDYLGKRVQKAYLACPEIGGEMRDASIQALDPKDQAIVDKMFPAAKLQGTDTFSSAPAEFVLSSKLFNIGWGGLKGETRQLRDTAGEFVATVPSIRIYNKDISIKLNGLRYLINSECDANMPARMFGQVTAKDVAAEFKFGSGPRKKLLLKGMQFESRSQLNGELVDVAASTSVNSVEFEQIKFGPIEMGISANRLHLGTLKRFVEESNKLNAQTELSAEERQAKLLALIPMLKDLVEYGPSVSLDKLRIQALDKGLTLDGRITLAQLEKADTEQPLRLLKKLDGELHITLTRPALKRAIDLVVTAMQKSKKDNPFKGIKPAEAKKMAYNMAESKLKEFAKGNFVKLDKDKITADVTFKDGKLTVNGKEIPLPPLEAPKEEEADSTAQ